MKLESSIAMVVDGIYDMFAIRIISFSHLDYVIEEFARCDHKSLLIDRPGEANEPISGPVLTTTQRKHRPQTRSRVRGE